MPSCVMRILHPSLFRPPSGLPSHKPRSLGTLCRSNNMPGSSSASSIGAGAASGRKLQRVEASFQNKAAQLMGDLHELAISELVDILRANPHKIAPCLHLAKRASLDTAPTAAGAEQPFHASVTKLYKIPKEFLRDYLVDLAPQKLPDQTLKRMEKHSEGTLRSIFYYSYGVFEKTTMPKLCLNKDTWRAAFKARHEALGSHAHASSCAPVWPRVVVLAWRDLALMAGRIRIPLPVTAQAWAAGLPICFRWRRASHWAPARGAPPHGVLACRVRGLRSRGAYLVGAC